MHGVHTLSFAASFAECGEHARKLQERCVGYVVEHFEKCSAEPSFLELPREMMSQLIGSEDLKVKEEDVMAGLWAWIDHDLSARRTAAPSLVPLIRFPLLPVAVQLALPKVPLVLRLIQGPLADSESAGMMLELMAECNSAFADSDAASECLRLRQRKGRGPAPVTWTGVGNGWVITEDGALASGDPDAEPDDEAEEEGFCLYGQRVIGGTVMNSGKHCAEFTLVSIGNQGVGVSRATADSDQSVRTFAEDMWAISKPGICHHGRETDEWDGHEAFVSGDTMRLLLDCDAGTLTVEKNGVLLGVAVSEGLTGDMCWAVQAWFVQGEDGHDDDEPAAVRVKAVDPAG